MSTTMLQRAQAAKAAGFYDGVQRNGQTIESLGIIVSISECECSLGHQPCDDGGCNYDCCPASESCGQWQIFQAAHPGTAALASTLDGCAQLAWGISNHGTSFSAWSTFNNGCYLNNLNLARAAVDQLTNAAPVVNLPPVVTVAKTTTYTVTSAPAGGESGIVALLLLAGAVGIGALGFHEYAKAHPDAPVVRRVRGALADTECEFGKLAHSGSPATFATNR